MNEEAVKNLGYMQLKKTHDAAMVLMERVYGEKPRFNYFFGSSQGGREALTVAQRYPADYDGIAANVPIVSFSSLMLGPDLIRIQERPLANWVPPAKVNAIRGEFMRQCDKLDGLADGIINNYNAFAFQQIPYWIIFYLCSEIPYVLVRLNECPSDIVVPYQSLLVRNTGRLAVTNSRAVS